MTIDVYNFVELCISQINSQVGQNSLELLTCNDIFPEPIIIQEKLSNSNPFQSDFSLDFSDNTLNGKEFGWYFFLKIECFR